MAEGEISNLFRALMEMGRNAEVLKRAIHSVPGLFWVKRRLGPSDYRMVAVSEDYARLYLGGPPELYEGKCDSEIWGPEIAKTFAENDDLAFGRGRHAVREEISSPFTGTTGVFVGVKWGFQIGEIAYVGGAGQHTERIPKQPSASATGAAGTDGDERERGTQNRPEGVAGDG